MPPSGVTNNRDSDVTPVMDAPARDLDMARSDLSPQSPDLETGSPAWSCTVDDVAGFSPSGSRLLPLQTLFTPLCSGSILMGVPYRLISQFDVPRGVTQRTYPVPGDATHLLLDTTRGRLFMTNLGNSVERLDLFTGAIDSVPLVAPGYRMAEAWDGRLFVLLPNGDMNLVDADKAVVLTTFRLHSIGSLLAFRSSTSDLIFAGGSALVRYGYDPAAMTLTLMQELPTTTGNCTDLALSPDESRLAVSCFFSLGQTYSDAIDDLNSDDFTASNGQWKTIDTPSGAAFSPDGRYFASTNYRDSTMLFDAKSHALIATQPLVDCPQRDWVAVSFSRGSRILYTASACVNMGVNVAWWVVP